MNVITSDSYVSKMLAEPRIASGTGQQHTISRRPFLQILAACEFAADFITCATVMLAAYSLQLHIDSTAIHPLQKALGLSVFAGLIAAVLLRRNRTYSEWASIHPVIETVGAVRMSLQALAIILPASFLLRFDLPRSATVLAFVLMPPILVLQKQIFASAVKRLHHQRSHSAERVVIYGAGEMGRRIASTLLSSPRLAFRPVAIVDEDLGSIDDCRLEFAYHECPGIAVQCHPITADLLKSLQCDLLVITNTSLSAGQRDKLRAVAEQAGSRIAHLSESLVEIAQPKQSIEIDGLILTYETAVTVPWPYAFGKRLVDIIVSSILLVLLSPLFLLIALLIRLSSTGPAFFVQKRVGRDGSLFRMYKFRSMSRHARKYECSPKTSSDPRITKIGRFLRRTSIDELPQLINVFLGQMSLVGPRPEMPFIVRRYNARQRLRLQVIPGITGLWQLSPDRAYPIHENVHHDLSYIRHRTFSMDLAILIHTLFFAMRGGV
ncbi:MAG: exopolysaccharide biosynthesis polyprenyl glycosylphosphotransferase [Edaphobacter sp.]